MVFSTSIKAKRRISFYRVKITAVTWRWMRKFRLTFFQFGKKTEGFFSGKGSEGMLILTNKNLCFVKKTEAAMRWWGAIRTRQVVRLLQSKDVMIVEDGYDEENLKS